MFATTVSVLGLGFALGLKHALDADHLAAVAVIVGEDKPSILSSSKVGVAWGMGHASALTLVSLAVILLDFRVPDTAASWMEFLVGVVLAALGGRMVLQFRRGAVIHAHSHQHGARLHFHPHMHRSGLEADHLSHHQLPAAAQRAVRSAGRGRAPFLVGVLHGMAGSAALTLLILTAIPGTLARLGYVVVFGVGSIFGMLMMSTLIGLPFALGKLSGLGAQRGLRLAAGSLSLGLGLYLMASIGPDLLL